MENRVKPIIHRREGLILTTIDIIDELGIQGLTTKEIAKRQNVSEATLFRHFKSKNELLIAALEHFSQYDKDIFRSIEIKRMKPREAILYFIETYAIYYQNYPAITAMTQIYDVLRCDVFLADKVKYIFSTRGEFMKKIIEDAQKSGEISQEIDSEELADILTSVYNGICLKWRMNEYGFPLREKIVSAISSLLDAFGVLDETDGEFSSTNT
ncbi:MAG: TetR/AcrR family transcriptional regulator [Thermotaleaceae bacterium]